jgi:hypothetical protein
LEELDWKSSCSSSWDASLGCVTVGDEEAVVVSDESVGRATGVSVQPIAASDTAARRSVTGCGTRHIVGLGAPADFAANLLKEFGKGELPELARGIDPATRASCRTVE